jgi:hypothetical protein
VLERFWRRPGDVLERFWRGSREVLERFWRGSGEVLERSWGGSRSPGKVPETVLEGATGVLRRPEVILVSNSGQDLYS